MHYRYIKMFFNTLNRYTRKIINKGEKNRIPQIRVALSNIFFILQDVYTINITEQLKLDLVSLK